MAGRGMMQRLVALEQRGSPAVTRYHWIIGEPGETRDNARARYELEQCPISANEGIIFWNQFTDNGRVPICA